MLQPANGDRRLLIGPCRECRNIHTVQQSLASGGEAKASILYIDGRQQFSGTADVLKGE
jgi:hypothetical protein